MGLEEEQQVLSGLEWIKQETQTGEGGKQSTSNKNMT